jgi:hypothetical protein
LWHAAVSKATLSRASTRAIETLEAKHAVHLEELFDEAHVSRLG